MKNLLFTLFIITICAVTAQEITINGIVSAESNPLPGANVTIKNNTTGTQTDFDGSYQINAKIGDILIFSFIGYQNKEISIVRENKVDVELNIDANLEVDSFCCCFPSSSFSPIYIHGIKYDNNGILLEIENLYKLGQNFRFKFGYQSDFKDNYILNLEGTVNNLFYIDSNYNATFKYRNFNIEQIEFNSKDYKLTLGTFYKTLFNYRTKFYLGFGISNMNKEHNFGIEGGFHQYLFSSFAIYSHSTYWSNYWEFKNGIKFTFKRMELFGEHHQIANYYDYNIGIGYKFYF